MTFDDLVPAWNSASNAPDPAQLDCYKASIVRRLHESPQTEAGRSIHRRARQVCA